ncbi:MAG: hypothetical protein M3P06_08340 [Acidobacteriota bacterium]|nr:hypothetical protein [Acidobacteriota bacterium]
MLLIPLTAAAVEPSLAPGATIDRASFRVVRPIPKAPAGLAVLVLDADVLGNSCDLADVRIVTADDRQVPYLTEKRDTPLVVPLTLARVEAPRGTSVYRVDWPYSALPCETRMVFSTSTRVFERTVSLRSVANHERGRGANVIASATWRATDPEAAPPVLTFDAASTSDARDGLEVIVGDGDNAPLPITRAELVIPSTALRFHHPGSQLFLLYGNDPLMAPRYDLALLAPRLLAQPARELKLALLTETAEKATEPEARKYFWIAIVAAAVVLLALLVKLLGPRTFSASD